MDRHGCDENDPNGPVFDPVHGVVHHFFQNHVSRPGGDGPTYGHFVSRDFVHWAQLPVAIWNGINCNITECGEPTPYDSVAIYTGSAVVVDGAGPGGKGKGIINIYPGLCNRVDWANCFTGTLLAYAVPADYKHDPLLERWTKPSFNPIMENTQRDPSTPWRMPNGEWRMSTYDAMYGSASDADMLKGKWYRIGNNFGGKTAECPSFFPLPGPTPGFEAAYEKALKRGTLPTHVYKYSENWKDHWAVGSYHAGKPRSTGRLEATPGWESLFHFKIIDNGNYYACKDNEYPTKTGEARRINWGWATIPHGSQTLPRVITFNAEARCLEQAPLDELVDLRGPAAFSSKSLELNSKKMELKLHEGVLQQSEVVVSFRLPKEQAMFGVSIASPSGYRATCVVQYNPPGEADSDVHEVPVYCRKTQDHANDMYYGQEPTFSDSLPLLKHEKSLELRLFYDHVILEAYFQRGRVALTLDAAQELEPGSKLSLMSSSQVWVADVSVYPMENIWVSREKVREAKRVYPAVSDESHNAGFVAYS